MPTKYIFISGGVISGLGKGITLASIALLLKSAGFKVAPIKADPYLNLDAGTMNPIIHGETFVTEDGLETDQDLGHYERFIDENLTRLNYMTAGQVYLSVIERERRLEYGGICVETIPHIPREIIKRLNTLAEKSKADFVILEIGGTVGEYQNAMFLEAAREMSLKIPNDVLNIHVAYLPLPPSLGELKSKPVQTSVQFLHTAGIRPDIIIGRAVKEIDNTRKEKISTFCSILIEDIFSNPDMESIYQVPEYLEKQGITDRILDKLDLSRRFKDIRKWSNFVKKINSGKRKVKIGIVGKYFRSGDFSLEDSYVCVMEAVKQASWWNNVNPEITWIDSIDVEEKGADNVLADFDGLIVPQGWGSRGIEGKILTAGFARQNKIPYLGLCFGMQLACIEFARNVCMLEDSNTEEAKPDCKNPIIHIMPNQKEYLENRQYGATMRLGAWPCVIKENSTIYKAYDKWTRNKTSTNYQLPKVQERHRHRFEFNNRYRQKFEQKGMVFSGISPDGQLVEAVEIPSHPFFVGTQFHPEFKARPMNPHPLFLEFIAASLK
ncbi:CTP synthetase [Candidatus Gottesmanbacteria bacterium CG11_big_fil_rev_8_21_14_0_20_37_11]|uniref:CTP synthase n=3 Tax=Candidatus Gottesmaniibacteriota TaxID=1752720 RepID=A0A2M7RQD5_9BACT|nr:MAG: CTP synthase [Candidatus Gottesmanbacteria bacterium CG1_02_37_22]PIP32494.1 MAG: CTP synthetase [Candidatus Gottesmanbacteria bacterium CG23_combo_of_CG06-09_8_20_14_all_37_19]PIR08867.1 MAG: CTP synthetase [Candidatus Gottesmanbacteria bacterium CG11_big_fil_rev_8_21_14_0_20_37_11]PIZ02518.1 MAG: CTP synthase [Candidatus Gottesmanbacteria bacterium CG_4_10_14_0_8_um_filter_37_24]